MSKWNFYPVQMVCLSKISMDEKARIPVILKAVDA